MIYRVLDTTWHNLNKLFNSHDDISDDDTDGEADNNYVSIVSVSQLTVYTVYSYNISTSALIIHFLETQRR